MRAKDKCWNCGGKIKLKESGLPVAVAGTKRQFIYPIVWVHILLGKQECYPTDLVAIPRSKYANRAD